ncbi:hypothetical protein D3C75_829790 [compost metagenome]
MKSPCTTATSAYHLAFDPVVVPFAKLVRVSAELGISTLLILTVKSPASTNETDSEKVKISLVETSLDTATPVKVGDTLSTKFATLPTTGTIMLPAASLTPLMMNCCASADPTEDEGTNSVATTDVGLPVPV